MSLWWVYIMTVWNDSVAFPSGIVNVTDIFIYLFDFFRYFFVLFFSNKYVDDHSVG